MISVNPIFFPSNSISDLTSENSTKLFKNPKYLFADLIKVNENIVDEETGFPESFFKFSQNISKQTLQGKTKAGKDNTGETEINADFYPVFSSIQNLVNEIVKPVNNVKWELPPQQKGNTALKIKNANKEELKTFLTDLVNNSTIKLSDVKILTDGNQSVQKSESIDLSLAGEQQISAEQISKIIEQLDNGSVLSFDIKGTDVAKVSADLQKFIAKVTGEEPATIENVKSGNQLKTNQPAGENKIVELINYFSENDDVKLEIKVAAKNEPGVENDKTDTETLNRIVKKAMLNKPVNAEANKNKSVTDKVFVNPEVKTGDDEKKFTVSLKLSGNETDDEAIETKGPQFITKDAFKTMLQHDSKLKQLRSKVSDIFKNVEHVNVSEEPSGNKPVQVNNKTIVDQETGNDKTKRINNIFTANETIDEEVPATIETNVNRIFAEKEANQEKVTIEPDGKIKIQYPEITKRTTDKTTAAKQPVSDNIELAKKVEVKTDTPEPDKTVSKETNGNKQVSVDQNPVIDENETKISVGAAKHDTKLKAETNQSPEKVVVTRQEKNKFEVPLSGKINSDQVVDNKLTELNQVKNSGKYQAQLDKTETIKTVEKTIEAKIVEPEIPPEKTVKVNETEIGKPISEIKEQGNPVKVNKLNYSPEEIKVNKTEFENPANENKTINEKSNPGKIVNTKDEKVENAEFTKIDTKKPIEVKQPKLEQFKIVDENKIKINKTTINKPDVESAVENKQPVVNENTETDDKIYKHSAEINKQKSVNLNETVKVNTGKPEPVQVENVKTNKPEFISQYPDKEIEINQSNPETVKAAKENESEHIEPVINKSTIEKPGKREQLTPNKTDNVIKETVKVAESEFNRTVIEKPNENSKPNIEKVKFNPHETNKTIALKESHVNDQNNSEFNEHSQEQKKSDYTASTVKDKPEMVSFDPDKKVNPGVNEIAGIKENFVDKSLTNHVVLNKTENVQSQQKIINNQEVFSRVSELIQTRDKKSIEIKLDPPDLGKMNIRIDHEQNKIYLNIEVKDENVRGMIYHNLDQLKQSMNQNGLQLQDVFVSLNGEDQKQNKSFGKNKRGLTSKSISFKENTDTELSSKKMGYNTYDYLI